MLPDNPRIREGIALQRRGDVRGAAARYASVLKQQPDDPEALHYLGLAQFQLGQPAEAEKLLLRSSERDPDQANTWSDLGMVRMRLDRTEDALPAFEQALKLAPEHPDALNNMAQALRKLGRFAQAKPLLERLVALKPKAVSVLYALADTQNRMSEVDEAISTYNQAVKLAPDDPRIRLGLGDAYESNGRFRQARMQYLSILRREPDSALALARLLQLREGNPEPEQVERARKLADSPSTKEDGRVRLNIALGYFHDRQKQFDEAFEHLQRGYEVLARREPFDSDGYTRAIDALIEELTPEFFASAQNSGIDSERPIFVVGMPRSGTTLTEQILASHSQVDAGGELSSLLKVSYQTQELSATGEPYPRGLKSVDRQGLVTMANRYLQDLDRVSEIASRVTDKLPFNFMHLGVIALLFPNARIIHCRRHPLDNCLSCYFTSFADQIRFANRLDTLGRYYLDYHRLMKHWHEVLPVEIFDLQYETLIKDTEPTVRALIDHCGLPWEDGCLSFHETQRAVRTPSRWQVRQPIYKGSMQRWRNYERQLQPLVEVLSPILDG
ncbi:MAG: tetratricopeptide repeat-containing sulfotransferase family protein [Pseudomonadota bacterium]